MSVRRCGRKKTGARKLQNAPRAANNRTDGDWTAREPERGKAGLLDAQAVAWASSFWSSKAVMWVWRMIFRYRSASGLPFRLLR